MPIKIKTSKRPYSGAYFKDSTFFLKRCWACIFDLLSKSFGSRHFFKACFLSCLLPFLVDRPTSWAKAPTFQNYNKRLQQKHQKYKKTKISEIIFTFTTLMPTPQRAFHQVLLPKKLLCPLDQPQIPSNHPTILHSNPSLPTAHHQRIKSFRQR